MNKEQIEMLLHYVTSAIEQSKVYKYYGNYYDSYEKKTRKKSLSKEEIIALETRKSILENLLKDAKDNYLRCGKENIDEYHICNS